MLAISSNRMILSNLYDILDDLKQVLLVAKREEQVGLVEHEQFERVERERASTQVL